MPPLPPRASRYSASSSSRRHSPNRPCAGYGRASCGFLQRGRSTQWRGELAINLWARLRRTAGSEPIEHLSEALLGQILVGVFPDQHHRGVHAGAETLHLFPAEISILGELE